MQVTEQTRSRPDILEALRHLSRIWFQLSYVRTIRLICGQKSAGNWPGRARSLAIWRFSRNPSDVRHIHLHGVRFDARQLIGEHWK